MVDYTANGCSIARWTKSSGRDKKVVYARIAVLREYMDLMEKGLPIYGLDLSTDKPEEYQPPGRYRLRGDARAVQEFYCDGDYGALLSLYVSSPVLWWRYTPNVETGLHTETSLPPAVVRAQEDVARSQGGWLPGKIKSDKKEDWEITLEEYRSGKIGMSDLEAAYGELLAQMKDMPEPDKMTEEEFDEFNYVHRLDTEIEWESVETYGEPDEDKHYITLPIYKIGGQEFERVEIESIVVDSYTMERVEFGSMEAKEDKRPSFTHRGVNVDVARDRLILYV
jgi:hypothetical protein